jgi:hypothetical protein
MLSGGIGGKLHGIWCKRKNEIPILPNATRSSMAKISVGTKLKILDKSSRTSPGGITVIWYEVEYKNRSGWISEHACRTIDQ